MKQLTIRGFDPTLERRVREVARARRVSLNRAVLWLLRRGAGLGDDPGSTKNVGDSLDRLVGTWTEEEEREFLEAVEPFERVDESLWS